MTKKRVTTTYKREFSPERSAQRPSAIRCFDANNNYREYRRALEHGHQRSPFVWDDWEYELGSSDEDIQQQQKPTANIKKKNQQGSISPGSHVSSNSGSGGNRSAPGSDMGSILSSEAPSPRNKQRYDQQCQTSVREPRRNLRAQTKIIRRKLGRRGASPQSDDECNCGADYGPKNRYQGQPVRVLSDTISKSLKKVSKKAEHAGPDSKRSASAPIDSSPFVQYGTGDDERETGAKRTHNILSKEGVYPSASEAKLRHQVSTEYRRSQIIKPHRPKTAMFDPRFDNRMNKETAKWQSEYNKNFRQFPTTDYSRNSKHKPPY